jgi:hypothetical protein
MREHVSHWMERKHKEFKENQKVLPKYEWLLHKFEAAIADASWRRDIHRANDALMQNHRKRCLWALCFGLDAQDGLAGFQAQGISSSRRLLGQLLTSLVSTSVSHA